MASDRTGSLSTPDGFTVNPAMISDNNPSDFDDPRAFEDLNMDILDNDTFFQDGQDNWNFIPTPPERGLYSTPLSWEPPKPPQQQPQLKQEAAVPAFRPTMTSLTPAQREKLRSIAMPEHLQYNPRYSPESATISHKSESGSPDHGNSSRKRKSSAEVEDDDDDDGDGSHPPVKKTAHNMIEKRYRTNLNDKIAALRDSVPSLRVMSKNARGEDTTADKEDLQGLTPAHKLNKATVLSKATEYIRHLEKRNKRLQDDNLAMKARIQAFEKLFMSGSMGLNPVQTPMEYAYQPQDTYISPTNGKITPNISPQGMIEVPEDIRRMNAQTMQQNDQIYQPQERYINPQQNQVGPNGAGWPGNGYFGRMMVGSLAALMILEGFTEAEQEGDEPAGRGLFSLPVQMLRGVSKSLHSPNGFSALGYQASSGQALLGLKIMLIVGSILYIFIPSIFDKKSSSANGKSSATSLTAAPSLASSIQVRRQAWLTAIQTVWVPHHNFFLEAAALIIKTLKLSLRNMIGWYGYATLTGITEQQETARVKAWSIALDAQLGGGDVEISKSRLTLTLLASGTLPDTPARLMMKALHIRVLFWEFGSVGLKDSVLQQVAVKLAVRKWNEARQLQRIVSHSPSPPDCEYEPLPSHLAALLEMDCADVLVDSIVQRAHNLAWNQPTTHNIKYPSDDMDAVVSDFAIRSPLDAVAAWFSNLNLQAALCSGLTSSPLEVDVSTKLDTATRTAPIGSTAQACAIVARAILQDEKRGANIAAATQMLSPPEVEYDDSSSLGSLFVNSTLSTTMVPDVKMSLSCAVALAQLKLSKTSDAAYDKINGIRLPRLSLLGFTAAYKLMVAIDNHPEAANRCSRFLESLAGNLRIWIGSNVALAKTSGMDRYLMEEVVEKCVGVSKRCIGMLVDDGYESMSQDEGGEGIDDIGC